MVPRSFDRTNKGCQKFENGNLYELRLKIVHNSGVKLVLSVRQIQLLAAKSDCVFTKEVENGNP
jgi:hypothetical protein